MNTLKSYITEKFNTHDILLYAVVKVAVPGKKRKRGIAVYNFKNFNDSEEKLEYSDQIIFKYYCFYKWGIEYDKYEGLHKSWVPVDSFKTGEDFKYNFYFDGIDCVDGETDKNIQGVVCDGSLTWREAEEKLEEHFGIGV
ncbi:MAG: hypothetical protein J6D03_00075 [Clostridia bacterium]|nr:hypothetical protein [Clostridia bacterium]